MTKEEKEKTCFVIAPIGGEGSETRKRSDHILKYIIEPAARECGYMSVVRADKISQPGGITSQVIEQLLEADLVIADISERNANVFYELAIRHAIRKPVVQLIQFGESIPFDVSGQRTIYINYPEWDTIDICKEKLKEQIHAVEEDPSRVDSPISIAIDIQSLRQSLSDTTDTTHFNADNCS